jgi:hypothetical protein
MLKRLYSWVFRRRLSDALCPTRVVWVHRVPFVIRRLSPLDYLDGSKATRSTFDTYKTSKAQPAEVNLKALKDTYVDVFMAAVMDPPLSRKVPAPGAKEIWVENLLTDWSLATELYQEILLFTYGKKKFSQLSSLASAS